jgi:hypothetical protein
MRSKTTGTSQKKRGPRVACDGLEAHDVDRVFTNAPRGPRRVCAETLLTERRPHDLPHCAAHARSA